MLLYLTGGFAYAGVREGFAMTDTFGNNGRTGFAAGGGIEWMFLPNWSLKAEYQNSACVTARSRPLPSSSAGSERPS
jgi:outer membrane immunogenic protein